MYPGKLSLACVLIVSAALLASCDSMPTAAPVIERSPNAAPPRKPVAAKPATPAPAPTPTAPAPTTPAPASGEIAKAAPAAAPVPPPTALPDKPAAAVEEPVAKPYREGDWRPEYYVVKKGDTLYSIALDYGLDYRELAAWNSLEDPGLIKIDQRLRLFAPEGSAEVAAPRNLPPATPTAVPVISEPKARKLPYSEQALAQLKLPAATAPAVSANAASPAKASVKPQPAEPVAAAASSATRETAADGRLTWEWPAQGKLLYGFGQGSIQKGIGIEGHAGQPVLAAAPGKVVYSGSGLRGYGKLIIVKHNATYLSVYAHNNRVLVKEGQTVAKGQKIAEIGDTDSDRIALHFEIRRLGKPIDPVQFLPERS